MKKSTHKANDQAVIQTTLILKSNRQMKYLTNNKEAKSKKKGKDRKWIKVNNLSVGTNTKGRKKSLYLRAITMTYRLLQSTICAQRKSLMRDLLLLITITERLNIPNSSLIPADLSVSSKSTEER